MPDREKVIEGLECCTHHDCYDCYQEGPGFGIACRDSLMRDALAVLKEQEASGWISVKDRLPEKQGVYLVAFKQPLPKVTIAWWATREYGWYDLEYNFHTDGISHWMPLPPMPEQEVTGDDA